VVQAPLTAAVIVMEMTANPGMRLPLLAVAFLGFATARLIAPAPLYRVLAARFEAAFDRPVPESAQAELAQVRTAQIEAAQAGTAQAGTRASAASAAASAGQS